MGRKVVEFIMEKNKAIKCGLFGYKKKSVLSYINEIVTEYEKQATELKDEINEIKKQNQTLMNENAAHFKAIEEYEAERESISGAIISAQLRARKVLDEAEQEMATLKANKAAEIALAEEDLKKIKEEIGNLKLSAIATLHKYESQMEDLIK